MNKEELNIIEKYMSEEEIKDIIQEELRGKLRKDFQETYSQTLFNPDAKYINNWTQRVFRQFFLENYSENLHSIAKQSLKKFDLSYVLGHTWDRKEYPESINRLDAMKIVNKAFEESKDEIKDIMMKSLRNANDDYLLDLMTNSYHEHLFKILDNLRNENSN